MLDRRAFIVGGFGAALATGCRSPIGENLNARFRLAMAGYTLYSFETDEALSFCEKNGFRYLCVKERQLPYDSSSAQIREFRRKCEDHGVTPYGVGPVYMYDADEAKRRFDYAAALGVRLMSGVPTERYGDRKLRSNRKLCEVVSGLVAEYDMRFAIHNHGRNPETGSPELFAALPETWEIIKDLDRRVGFCVDWAYTFADGLDCVAMARLYADRIYDGHVRCLSDAKNGSSGTTPLKRVFDYDGVFAELKAIGYDGCLGLELANAFPDHPEWIVASRDYFEGLIDAI